MGATDYTIRYPFGEADSQVLTPDTTVEVTIVQDATLVTFDAALAADMTLNLAAFDTELPVGSQLTVKALSDGTARDITLGTGFEGTVVAGVISKTIMSIFQFDGTSYVLVSSIQTD